MAGNASAEQLPRTQNICSDDEVWVQAECDIDLVNKQPPEQSESKQVPKL